ncbi:MAG: hypothetical protein MH825_12760 [Cyanobacteria bacterium]|nr:hypothetical protein [Cyanobacteriota bacterium]
MAGSGQLAIVNLGAWVGSGGDGWEGLGGDGWELRGDRQPSVHISRRGVWHCLAGVAAGRSRDRL